MNWKEKLRISEDTQQWDDAIEFMQQVIKENSNDMDAYICINSINGSSY